MVSCNPLLCHSPRLIVHSHWYLPRRPSGCQELHLESVLTPDTVTWWSWSLQSGESRSQGTRTLSHSAGDGGIGNDLETEGSIRFRIEDTYNRPYLSAPGCWHYGHFLWGPLLASPSLRSQLIVAGAARKWATLAPSHSAAVSHTLRIGTG